MTVRNASRSGGYDPPFPRRDRPPGGPKLAGTERLWQRITPRRRGGFSTLPRQSHNPGSSGFPETLSFITFREGWKPSPTRLLSLKQYGSATAPPTQLWDQGSTFERGAYRPLAGRWGHDPTLRMGACVWRMVSAATFCILHFTMHYALYTLH